MCGYQINCFSSKFDFIDSTNNEIDDHFMSSLFYYYVSAIAKRWTRRRVENNNPEREQDIYR